MVIVDVVTPVGDQQGQFLNTPDVDVNRQGRGGIGHHSALPQDLPVAQNEKFKGCLPRHLVIYSHRSDKPPPFSLQVNEVFADGMGAYTSFKNYAIDGQRIPVH